MTAYYNEHDKHAAQWLRELIADGLIAPGEVDERSIEEVQPQELKGFTQCHFFAGIGVWSYALRNAGWSDSTPVWTGSCPCQPFSTAGKRGGSDDSRHLWPAWFRLIGVNRPDTIFGEQVSSSDGRAWLDVVSSDLEGEGYAIGALSTNAAGVGAPHIRQRLYFVAHAGSGGLHSRQTLGSICEEVERTREAAIVPGHHGPIGMAQSGSQRCNGEPVPILVGRPQQARAEATGSGTTGRLADSEMPIGWRTGNADNGRRWTEEAGGSGSTGFWDNAIWHPCRDGKLRQIPAEPSFFPLVTGPSPGRVGLLRGAGNALCSVQAQAFIEAYMNIEPDGAA